MAKRIINVPGAASINEADAQGGTQHNDGCARIGKSLGGSGAVLPEAELHGVAQVRGPARIEIDARPRDDRLVIEVADSGPGPGGPGSRPAPGRSRRGSGYGLKNIRKRLAGHYGERAELELRRDEERAMTVARIELPLARGESHGAA